MYLEVPGNMFNKKWVIENNKVICRNGKKIYEIGLMHKLELDTKDGIIRFKYEDNPESVLLVFSKAHMDTAKKAFNYMKENALDANPIEISIGSSEFRKRCNVCGKIYCYNMKDIKDDLKNATKAMLSSIGAMGNALGGTQIGFYANASLADRHMDKISDYTRCPSCNSTNVSDITEEEFVALSTPKATISGADEILKYKNLLDMGIITEEEFQLKKKELLGL